ncbi:MAG: hypothetical protein KIH64_000110, partial [Mycobacterium sp.]|nr:hypothetical protein [Mycobacterium sp.]
MPPISACTGTPRAEAAAAIRRPTRGWVDSFSKTRAHGVWASQRSAAAARSASSPVTNPLAIEEGKTRMEGVGEVRRAAQILRYYGAEGDRA